MVVALLLQMFGLLGLPIGGFVVGSWGGGLIGASVSAVYVGLALEDR